jgi:hypothetical protein
VRHNLSAPPTTLTIEIWLSVRSLSHHESDKSFEIMEPKLTWGMEMTNLYLDVDGVFLLETGDTGLNGRTEYKIAKHTLPVLKWCLQNFECYWLTARSSEGSIEEVARAFRLATGSTSEILNLVKSITVAPWAGAKIMGIDLHKPFVFVDDNIDAFTYQSLLDKGLADCWIYADSVQNEYHLLEALASIKGARKGSNFVGNGK